MTCEELRPDYPSYALGILEEPERAEIAEHLGRAVSETCMAGVASALATVSAMSGAVKITEPPKSLRRRVIASVEREPKTSRAGVFLPWVITAALSLALLAIGISGRRQIGDTEKLRQALSILNDPAAKDVSFGESQKPSKGRVFVSADKGVVFIGANLPRIDSEQDVRAVADSRHRKAGSRRTLPESAGCDSGFCPPRRGDQYGRDRRDRGAGRRIAAAHDHAVHRG